MIEILQESVNDISVIKFLIFLILIIMGCLLCTTIILAPVGLILIMKALEIIGY